MFTANQILDKLNADKEILKSLHLYRIGLFGSVARGTHNENSDLDFLIEFETGFKTFKNFMKIADYLENNFGKNFDMLTKESVSEYIYSCILKDIKYVQIIH
jgi:uncharacterized protein